MDVVAESCFEGCCAASVVQFPYLINTLNPSKASGKDDIFSFFIRLETEVLAPFLSVHFRYCFELGFFPSIFKTAKVVPIFKSRNKHLFQNYRSISLLPCLSKLLEKLIKSYLLKFFSKHKILYDLQYGFREKHNVLNALLDVTSFSYDAVQNKRTTALLLMDFTRAFDTVSHEILMHKLYHHGVRGPAYELIQGRTQGGALGPPPLPPTVDI